MDHRLAITRDFALCMSLAGRPGHFGTRFQNYLYAALDLPFVYKAFTTTDIEAAIGGIRALGIRGSAISMPFKEACIPFVDALTPSAAAIGSVNPIVYDDGMLVASNTDYIAVASLLAREAVPTDAGFTLRGSGGMAKAVAAALRDGGYANGTIGSRNERTGRALAASLGFAYAADATPGAALLINATPLGMADGPDTETLAFTDEAIDAATVVFDVVARPADTILLRAARDRGKRVITGHDVLVLQGVEQFVLYTGHRPEPALVEAAAAFAAG